MSFLSYAAGFDFTPVSDTVAATFDIDRDNVLVPTEEFRDGTRVLLQLPSPDIRPVAQRITGAIDTEHLVPSRCAGTSPQTRRSRWKPFRDRRRGREPEGLRQHYRQRLHRRECVLVCGATEWRV